MTVSTFAAPQSPAMAQPMTARTRSLVEWAEEASAAHHLATGLVDTAFAPKQYRGKPVEGAAAILAGSELGLSPLAALRSFDVIEGVASPRAITLRAIVQSLGHTMAVIESTEARCIVRAKRRGDDVWQESIWTIQRASKMKLTGKDNWQKQPQAMLLARATAEAARMVASDALLGIPYCAEEIADEVAVTVTPTATRTVRRADPPAPAPAIPAQAQAREIEAPAADPHAESLQDGARRIAQIREQSLAAGPPLPGEVDEAEPVKAELLITQAQMRKMRAVMADLGIGAKEDRDIVLAVVSRIVGRKLTSSTELTKAEATRLIDVLEADGAVLVAEVLDERTKASQTKDEALASWEPSGVDEFAGGLSVDGDPA